MASQPAAFRKSVLSRYLKSIRDNAPKSSLLCLFSSDSRYTRKRRGQGTSAFSRFCLFFEPLRPLTVVMFVDEADAFAELITISIKDNGKGIIEGEVVGKTLFIPGRRNKTKMHSTGYGFERVSLPGSAERLRGESGPFRAAPARIRPHIRRGLLRD
jgi:hypothetical protein